ncbi:hypothetical protein FGG08_006776 [Glutinoglossum americanum]|uniref:Uncharacterized protein n=1 Tax=Glutinoglossum americanum TaxID=1670608 RepID=A0A9P8L012_9PEZI|nr:hypothetical protein FGG08_006776 [Glutinoglossum americanum]
MARSIPGAILEQVTSGFLSADQSAQESLVRSRNRGNSKASIAKFIRRKTEIGSQILRHLLKYFTEANVAAQFRRWVGFLLCELLRDSDENKEALELGPADLQRSLGTIALEDKNQNLKIISGLIISHQVTFGSKGELYWPPTVNKEKLKEFPETASEDSQWLIGFQSFLEKFELSQPQRASEDISHEGGISVALEGVLTLLIPPNGQPPQFIDIPFRNIKRVDIRPCQQAEVPLDLLPEPPADVVLHLSPHEGHTHRHNAKEKSAHEIVISFSGSSDAAEVARYLKGKAMKVSETAISFIGIEKKEYKPLLGEPLPSGRGERWLGLNAGPFGDLGRELIGSVLQNSFSDGNESLEQHRVRETMSGEEGLDPPGKDYGDGEEQTSDDFTAPVSGSNGVHRIDSIGILGQELQGASRDQSGHSNPSPEQLPNSPPNARDAQSPLSPRQRRRLRHNLLELGAGTIGNTMEGSSDQEGNGTRRNSVANRQLLGKPSKKPLTGADKRTASKGSNKGKEVGEYNSSIYDFDQQEDPPPRPQKIAVKPTKEVVTASRPNIGAPAARSKESHSKNKKAKDAPAILKGRAGSPTKSTDWNEAFEERGEDKAVQLPAKPLKSNATTKPKSSGLRKTPRVPLAKMDGSSRKPRGKPTEAAAARKRKSAPVVTQPLPLRSLRAAAVSANLRILNMDKGSENGSVIDTQQEGGDVSQGKNDPVAHKPLLEETPTESMTPIGSDVSIQSDTDQVGRISSTGKVPGIAVRTSSSVTPTTIANDFRVQGDAELPGLNAKDGRSNMAQPNVEDRAEPPNLLTRPKGHATPSPVKGAPTAFGSLLSNLPIEGMPSISILDTNAQGVTRGTLTGGEDVKPLEQKFERTTGEPDEVVRVKLARRPPIVDKMHSALAAIHVPPSSKPSTKTGISPLDIQKSPKDIPPESPLGKRQWEIASGEMKEDRTDMASKKLKAGVLSDIPKAVANSRAASLDARVPTRNKAVPKAVSPPKMPPKGPVSVIELSSDESDDVSYYSSSSSGPEPAAQAMMQVSDKLQGAAVARHEDTTGAQKPSIKPCAVILHAPQIQADLTPRRNKGQSTALVDDRLSSKPKVVGWSGTGPRNQGRVVQRDALTAEGGLLEQAPQPIQRPVQEAHYKIKELAAGGQPQRITHTRGNQLYQTTQSRYRNGAKPHSGKGKQPKCTPKALPPPMKIKRQAPPLFVPRTNEDVVLNRGESHSTPIVEISRKQTFHRARVEESGSPIPKMKYFSQETRHTDSLRDAMTKSTSAKTVNDLEKELSLDGGLLNDNQIDTLVAEDAHLTTEPETAFSSNRKHGPRSPWAASEIEFVDQETVNIIQTEGVPSDPFTTFRPKSLNRFTQKLQAIGVGFQAPAKRKRGGPEQATTKRVRNSMVGEGGQTKGAAKITKIDLRQDPDRTLVNLGSDLELQMSSSGRTTYSGASQNTSGSSSSDDQRWSLRKDPRKQWRKSLKPHQSNMLDILYQVSDDLIRHLTDKETCIEDIVHDYQRGGTKLIQELEQSYQRDCDAYRVALGEVSIALKGKFIEARGRINEDVKQLKGSSVAAARKDWSDGQKVLMSRLKAAMDFVNA